MSRWLLTPGRREGALEKRIAVMGWVELQAICSSQRLFDSMTAPRKRQDPWSKQAG